MASRSYSVASAPDGSPEIEITVERLPDGEVSSFLHDEVMAGDELEVRGPIGGWFVWPGHIPALLIGGGSGVVPLMAMLRLARSMDTSDLVRLVVSVRKPADLYYATELPGPETTVIYTRQGNPSDTRAPGHLTVRDLPSVPDDATRLHLRILTVRRRRDRSHRHDRRPSGADPDRTIRTDRLLTARQRRD